MDQVQLFDGIPFYLETDEKDVSINDVSQLLSSDKERTIIEPTASRENITLNRAIQAVSNEFSNQKDELFEKTGADSIEISFALSAKRGLNVWCLSFGATSSVQVKLNWNK